MSLQMRIEQVVQEFERVQSWEDRYKKIIQMGKELGDLPDSMKTEESKVKGCQSQVWLHAHLSSEGLVQFQGDSDAMLVKGLVALLLRVYSNAKPAEILMTPPDFLQKLGFEGNLSPSRANGLFAMLKQIRNFALVFQVQQSSQN